MRELPEEVRLAPRTIASAQARLRSNRSGSSRSAGGGEDAGMPQSTAVPAGRPDRRRSLRPSHAPPPRARSRRAGRAAAARDREATGPPSARCGRPTRGRTGRRRPRRPAAPTSSSSRRSSSGRGRALRRAQPSASSRRTAAIVWSNASSRLGAVTARSPSSYRRNGVVAAASPATRTAAAPAHWCARSPARGRRRRFPRPGGAPGP